MKYAGAVLAVACATILTSMLEPWMGTSVSLFFFPAVLLSAVYGGYGPSLVATLGSVVSLAYFFTPPTHTWELGVDDAIRLTVFVVVALGTAGLSASRRHAQERERQSLLDIAARDHDLAIREERERVSRDLHDGILQGLTGIRLELQHIAEDAGAPTPIGERLLATERALAIEQRELRRLVEGLKLPGGEQSGRDDLQAQLQQRMERLSQDWKTPITVQVVPAGAEVPAPLQQAVVLMCHEAAANALKHGHPSRVSVSVGVADDTVTLTIVDDGRGFLLADRQEPGTIAADSGGPASLQDRAASLGGRVAVTSGIGGSRIEIAIPVDRDA